MNRPALTSIPASSLAFGEGRSSPKTYAAKSLEGSYIFPLCITFFGSVADLNATPVALALPNLSKLVGLVALCPACHNAKHFGLAQMKGQEQAALD